MNQELKDKLLLEFINYHSQVNFQNGGLCRPRFKTLDEYHQWNELMAKTFTHTTKQFKDFFEEGSPAITFDIPERYLKKERN